MFPTDRNNHTGYSVVIFGASGYLATRVIFPHFWELYRTNKLPEGTRFYGFTRRKMLPLFYKVKVMLGIDWDKENDRIKCRKFWNLFRLHHGDYGKIEDYVSLVHEIRDDDIACKITTANRIFYLATPPIVFEAITQNTSKKLFSPTGWNRIIVEKPFARNEVTCRVFKLQISQTFKDEQIYLINHNMGKDSIMNLMTLRFSNIVMKNTWNKDNIECVMITCKTMNGVGRRASYFDTQGIIRDFMHNHVMQILAFLGMEQPYSYDIEDIRREKLNVLRCVATVDMSDVVLGQYISNMIDSDVCMKSYIEEKGISPQSLTPTFAMVVVHIENKRWSGVPFILRCGMAMNEGKSEVRIQYKKLPTRLYGDPNLGNELIVCIHPQQDIYFRMMFKEPNEELQDIRVYQKRLSDKAFKNCIRPGNYDRLLLDVFAGIQLVFLSPDEVCECWRIFTPVLAKIDVEKIEPFPYPCGSRGPLAAYKKAESYGFKFFNTESPVM